MIGDVYAARLSVESDATLRGHVDSIESAQEKKTGSAGAGRGPQDWESTASDSPEPLAAAARRATPLQKNDGAEQAKGPATETGTA